MESYVKQNRRLMESGKTQLEIESAPWWDGDLFGISDTGQTLPTLSQRRDQFETWHYAPGLNQYFKTDRDCHGIIKAIETVFSPERWEEIEHLLDEMDVHRLLDMGNLSRLKTKILRARDKGFITTDEVQAMAQVVNTSA